MKCSNLNVDRDMFSFISMLIIDVVFVFRRVMLNMLVSLSFWSHKDTIDSLNESIVSKPILAMPFSSVIQTSKSIHLK